MEKDVGRDGEDLGKVDAELGNEIESEEADGTVCATGGQAGVELVLYVGGAGGWWG